MKIIQVKALSASRRRGLARIVIAVDDGDPDAIAAEMTAMGLMPGFESDGDDEGGEVTRAKKMTTSEEEGEGEEQQQQAPVDPLLAAMLATVIFDTTPLPAAAVNPLDDSGRSLLKLAPVKAFPSVRFFFFSLSLSPSLSLSLCSFSFFQVSKRPRKKTLSRYFLSLFFSRLSSNRTCSKSGAPS